MRSFFMISSILLAVSSSVSAYTPADTSQTDALAAAALSNLTEYVSLNSKNGTCTIESATRRREWYVDPPSVFGRAYYEIRHIPSHLLPTSMTNSLLRL